MPARVLIFVIEVFQFVAQIAKVCVRYATHVIVVRCSEDESDLADQCEKTRDVGMTRANVHFTQNFTNRENFVNVWYRDLQLANNLFSGEWCEHQRLDTVTVQDLLVSCPLSIAHL